MANKKITDLQLIDDIEGTESFPVDDSIQTYRATPLQLYNYLRPLMKPAQNELVNLSLTSSVGSSALTIAVKTLAGTDASSTDKIRVGFRSSTLTSGAWFLREISGALSLVISSGSTLGQVSTKASYIWVYLIDNAGTPELAVSHKKYSEDGVVTTVAEGGAGAADSALSMYSTSARTNVAYRLIGYILNTQTTAGTWASAGDKIQLAPFIQNKTPTMQTFTTPGAGTYYTPAGCTKIRVRLNGAGAGGRGSGTTGTGIGADGGATTFLNLLSGNGGKGSNTQTGGDGGTATISGATGLALTGSKGAGADAATITGIYKAGAKGGSTPFGDGGQSAGYGVDGAAATPNSGAGGQGGGISNTINQESGSGGGAGGYVDAWVTDLLASFTFSVGAGGAGGTPGTSGNDGGAGADGIIEVTEYYD